MKVNLKDRINFCKTALKKHLFLILGGLLFISIGCILIYIGTIVNEDSLFFYIFGGFFIAFILFIWIYTLPSSFMFYYEKALVKKYGSYTTATIISKTKEDHSYEDGIGKHKKHVEFYMYLIEYQFSHNSKDYINHFYLNEKTVCDKLEIGDSIPIKFLRTNPKESEPRRQKLCINLGLKRTLCS